MNFSGLFKRKDVVSGDVLKASPIKKVDNLLDLAVTRAGSDVSTTNAYNNYMWVNAAISLIARSISSIPLEFTMTTTAGTPRRVPKTDVISALFRNPNYEMSAADLWEATIVYYKTYGECLWVMPRSNVASIPEAIYPANPTNFTVDVDRATGVVKAYVYNTNSNLEYIGIKSGVRLAPHEVIQFKTFNPLDRSRGLEPSKILSGKLALDKYSEEYNKNFFRQGAKVDGFIETEDELTEEQIMKIKLAFEKIHSGYENAHKVGILEGGLKWKEAKITQKDMEFISLKKMTREEIFSIYGTNAIVHGLYEDVKSYEGIRAAHRIFWEDTLVPLCRYFQDQLYDKFLIDASPNHTPVFATYRVPVLQEDFNKKVEQAERLWRMGYPINAINRRLDLGFDEMSWGDEWWGAGSNTNIVEQFNMKETQPQKQEETVISENKVTEPPKKEETVEQKLLSDERFKVLCSKFSKIIFEDRADTLRCVFAGREKDNNKIFERYKQKTMEEHKDFYSYIGKELKTEFPLSISKELSSIYKLLKIESKKENLAFLIKRKYNSIDVKQILISEILNNKAVANA